jgi:hypothetical protein
MSAVPNAARSRRGSRVKLGGSVLALLLLENGRQIRARLSQLSVNGGLASLECPIDEGIKVTVVFHVGSTSFRNPGQMLFPMWATQGCLQPFRFLELPVTDATALALELDALVRAGALQEEDTD